MMRGGEIFVPKIPSMKMTDVATAISPKAGHKVVGIRPGEKLHEVLISAEDAWYTVEMDDRFSIEPSYRYWEVERKKLPGAKPVPEEFSYTSNNNSEWLQPRELLPLLGTETA